MRRLGRTPLGWLPLTLGLARCGDAISPSLDGARVDASRTEATADGALDASDRPDATLPDATLPDATLPDATLPDATPDATLPDATLPDATLDVVTDAVPDTMAPPCADGAGLCAGRCVELTSDPLHCGACGAACEAGLSCVAGSCRRVCPPGSAACADGCRDLSSDVMNCGACSRACGSDERCAAGACVYSVAPSCGAILRANPMAVSGLFVIDPDGAAGRAPIRVWCDMQTDGGGWMLVARLGQSVPASARGELRFDRTPASLETSGFASAAEFASWDLARLEPHGARWGVRVVVDSANDGTHTQSTYFRPRVGASVSLSTAGSNWLGARTADSLEYLTRSSNAGQRNRGWLPVQGFDPTSATVYLFAYRRASASGPCLDAAGENQLCHAPAGGITNEVGLAGTYTAAFGNGDGVVHAWGRRATYWVRDRSCAPEAGDCDGDVTNGCEVSLREDASHCGVCGRACATGEICSEGACQRAPSRNCQELLRAAPATRTGVHLIDPDGPGGMAPFSAHCDMDNDGGGWTLLASGDWRSAYADTVTGPGANAILSDGRRTALLATTGALYRVGDGAHRLFIEDRGAYWAPASEGGVRHYWRTNGASLRCATRYAAVMTDALTPVSTRAVSCDTRGVGSHTCGALSGWLLFHDRDTYNVSGAHPCAFGSGDRPTSGALDMLRVR
jgi:hypothetical protein